MEQIKQFSNKNEEISNLACIEIKDKHDPTPLFKEWYEEAQKYTTIVNPMSMATVSRNGQVSNRMIGMKEWIEDNEFLMTTNKNSNKAKDIDENPCVSLCFYWAYKRDNCLVHRQVVINGEVLKLDDCYCRKYYYKAPIHIKIRTHLFENGGERIEWQELKEKHDQLVCRVQNGEELKMPKHLIGYKIIPNRMVFYYEFNHHLADQVEFCKVGDCWESHHTVP